MDQWRVDFCLRRRYRRWGVPRHPRGAGRHRSSALPGACAGAAAPPHRGRLPGHLGSHARAAAAFRLLALSSWCAAHGRGSLPAGATHGLVDDLQQYPDVSLATSAQRAAAAHILEVTRQTSLPFRNPRAAERAGFDTGLARKPPAAVGFLHAENRRYSSDLDFFDPRRPEVLIYANQPGRPLVLIGVMFSMPRGKLGPGRRRPDRPVALTPGLRPWPSARPRSGERLVPRGARLDAGSEMLHLWFTKDLRSAYAVHAPVPELCRDGLARSTCRSRAVPRGM